MPATQLLEQAARFHGHLGPWLALGVRAGRYARRVLAATPFELEAVVRCPARPPASCFVDGVQFGSGCTLGKANIRHIPAQGCRVVFRRRGPKPGRPLAIEILPEVAAAIARPPRIGTAALARRLYSRRFDTLFHVTRPG